MADRQPPLSKRCRAFLRSILLFGLPLICGIAALANGAAKSNTADAVPYGSQFAAFCNSLHLRAGDNMLGDIYVTNDRMLRYHATYDNDQALQFIAQVNHFATTQSAPIYWIGVPTAAGIYAETLPQNAPQANEQALLSTAANALDDRITNIEIYSWLYAVRSESIYYRTDTHWTSYGAYFAYRTAIRKLGFSALGYDRFRITHLTASYQGNLAAETGYTRMTPDVVDLYECENGASCTNITVLTADGTQAQIDSLYDTQLCDDAQRLSHEAYQVFPAVDVPMLQIETDLKNSRHLLLLTDDFGAAMIPFLTQHYTKITVINTQLADSTLIDTIAPDITQIVFLYSADTITKGQWFAHSAT